MAKFQILTSSDNIFLIHEEAGTLPRWIVKNPQNEWLWTKKSATLKFKNPKKDATLFLRYDARVDLFTPPQQVLLKIGDQTVGQFTADAKAPTLITLPISAAQFGPADMVELVFDVDRTFKPGGGDPRELGIRVFNTYIEPK